MDDYNLDFLDCDEKLIPELDRECTEACAVAFLISYHF